MKSIHHVQQRSQNQDEGLRSFCHPAFAELPKRTETRDIRGTAMDNVEELYRFTLVRILKQSKG